MELCINQAWGTVCENRFDHISAGVVCVQLGGFYREGAEVIGSGEPGSGAIFLDEVNCRETDEKLLDCGLYTASVGLHSPTCDHSNDIHISCRGKTYVGMGAA